ncbi:early estrogen-induced gene 1 protein-like [Ruditapes philippinarum]|uniref:early estrogen-induced gene 1 protein-like n=1 Tax=Ruditapes philippinarum TaxID=129788 RepID=UPI00295BDF2E|nr:early estrogen-induced gene 1 protein-like [Ruditapes philippinarum]XP_060597585.1 early estrogen-induced gene 1 protein-like [Ruditapes philippinarum]
MVANPLTVAQNMMSFMSRKKKYKFHVTFDLEELSSVPFVSGILFAKIRLLEGGFSEVSNRKEVYNHCVKWNSKFSFECKMTSNASTGILDPCICRVSVRRELKGGKSYQKLGFADINLSEFAGSGQQQRRFLLEGYDSKHRQDNSTLKVSMTVSLVSGDPVFKVMTQSQFLVPGEDEESCENRVTSPEEGSLASNSSGFGSLPRKDRPSVISREDSENNFEKSHSRNGSYTSQHSRNGSNYGSLTHSRQNSSGTSTCQDGHPTHTRSPSAGSSLTEFAKAERRRKFEESSFKERRVDQTRVDAEGLVEELLASTDLKPLELDESAGLQLLVGKDGTMALR